MWSKLSNYRDAALLFFRLIFGSFFFYVHGWPKLTGGWLVGTPALGDWDGDGRLEVAVVRRDGVLLAWHTPSPVDRADQWPRFGHDLANTGSR